MLAHFAPSVLHYVHRALLATGAVTALLLWPSASGALHAMGAAVPVLPFMACVQLGQLLASALAWWLLLEREIPLGVAFRLRVVREGVDSLLPLAQVGGKILAVGLLAQRGVPRALAAAGTALDVLVEAATLLVVVLAGLGMVWALDGRPRVPPGLVSAVALGALGTGAVAVARGFGLPRLAEAICSGCLPPCALTGCARR